jgi:hypothetical protein
MGRKGRLELEPIKVILCTLKAGKHCKFTKNLRYRRIKREPRRVSQNP